MKRLINLLTLLLLGPAFASAACLPSQVCLVTSGTAVVLGAGPCPPGTTDCAPFNFAGNGFSASGFVLDPVGNGNVPGNRIFLPGSFFDEFFAGGTPNSLAQFELTINGVPWGIPAGGGADVVFSATLFIPGGGPAVAPFDFQGSFKGAPEPFAPGLGCDVLNCVNLEFRGSGLVTSDISDAPFAPGWFAVGQQTFTFEAIPEPTTLSLFAVGLVGLAMRRKAVAALSRHS